MWKKISYIDSGAKESVVTGVRRSPLGALICNSFSSNLHLVTRTLQHGAPWVFFSTMIRFAIVVASAVASTTHAVHTCSKIDIESSSSPVLRGSFDLEPGRVLNGKSVYRRGDEGGAHFLYSVATPVQRWVIGPLESNTGLAHVDSGAQFPFLLNARTRRGHWRILSAPSNSWVEDDTVSIRCGGWGKETHMPAPPLGAEGSAEAAAEGRLSTTRQPHATDTIISVTSAQFPHLNGQYIRKDRSFDNTPVYFNEDQQLYIFFYELGRRWIVSNELGGQSAIAYVEESDSASRWFVGDGAQWYEDKDLR